MLQQKMYKTNFQINDAGQNNQKVQSRGEVNQTKHKQKIEYLHKMLDNQILTVNSLFQKDNAFDQIQVKLKQLQIKLNSIKDDNSQITNKQFNSNIPSRNQSRNHGIFSIESSIVNQNFSSNKGSLPFESLSGYKKSKKTKQDSLYQKKSQVKQNQKPFWNEYSPSGKKLNFDIDEENQEISLLKKNKQNRRSINNKLNKKNKSQKIIGDESSKKRARSNIEKKCQQEKVIIQTITRHNSSKNKKISLSKQRKNESKQKIRSIRSSKKLTESKTFSHLQSWKQIMNTYGNRNINQKNKSENQNKHKIKQIIQKTEKKRLEKQLNNYKIKNSNLQHKLSQLRGYKAQFEKLKQIFQKQERIRKSRKRF